LPAPVFPPPQLPRIGPATPASSFPSAAIAARPVGKIITIPQPAPSHTATAPDRQAEPRALPLPRVDEPLIAPRTATRPQSRGSDTPLPRNRSLAKPGTGLLGVLGSWLRSTGQLLTASFMVKKKRSGPSSPATLRERTELTQLRAENRRLRTQLDGLATMRDQGDILSRAEKEVSD
jgi:hypothetical protein